MDFIERPTDNMVSGRGLLQRTNSFRKVLPSKPSATIDPHLSMSMKMIDRPVVSDRSNRGNKLFFPYMLEYAVMAEYLMIQKQELSGIYVIPSDQDPKLWFGVIFIRHGIYQGGIFRFCLHLPDNFPDGQCPKVVFETKVFHPAVNLETGELNVQEEFREWKRTINHIWHVLQYVRRIFYTIESCSPINVAAHDMFLKDNAKFKEMVTECVNESQNNIYKSPAAEDLNYLSFEPIESAQDSVFPSNIGEVFKGQNFKHF